MKTTNEITVSIEKEIKTFFETRGDPELNEEARYKLIELLASNSNPRVTEQLIKLCHGDLPCETEERCILIDLVTRFLPDHDNKHEKLVFLSKLISNSLLDTTTSFNSENLKISVVAALGLLKLEEKQIISKQVEKIYHLAEANGFKHLKNACKSFYKEVLRTKNNKRKSGFVAFLIQTKAKITNFLFGKEK